MPPPKSSGTQKAKTRKTVKTATLPTPTGTPQNRVHLPPSGVDGQDNDAPAQPGHRSDSPSEAASPNAQDEARETDEQCVEGGPLLPTGYDPAADDELVIQVASNNNARSTDRAEPDNNHDKDANPEPAPTGQGQLAEAPLDKLNQQAVSTSSIDNRSGASVAAGKRQRTKTVKGAEQEAAKENAIGKRQRKVSASNTASQVAALSELQGTVSGRGRGAIRSAGSGQGTSSRGRGKA